VKLLLDTHIALWAVTDSPKLRAAARELIVAAENSLYVSAASIWEIAIKYALNAASNGGAERAGTISNGAGRGGMPVSAARAADSISNSIRYVVAPPCRAHALSASSRLVSY
jgi:hypothetical protein